LLTQHRSHWTSKVAVSLVVAAVCLYFLLQVDIVTQLPEALTRLDAYLLVAALVVRFATDIARSLRFAVLLDRNDAPAHMFGITAILGFANQAIPFRIGEFSFPLLARRVLEIPLARGIGAVLAARALDLIVVSFVGSAALAFGPAPGGWSLALASVSAAAMVALLLARPLAHVAVSTMGGRLPSLSAQIAQLTVASEYAATWRRGGLAIIFTVVVWGLTIATFTMVLAGMGISGGAAVAVATALMAVSLVLPINGAAGIGPAMFAFAFGLSLHGHGWDQALVAAAVVQLFLLLSSGLSAIAGGTIVFILGSARS